MAIAVAAIVVTWAGEALGDSRCRDRGNERNRVCGVRPFQLSTAYTITPPGALPSSSLPSGLVALCSPNAGGTAWQCLQADGSSFGTVTEGTGADYQLTPFAGRYAASDITTAKASHVVSTTLDALFKTDHTVVMAWYATTAANASYQHVFGVTDASSSFYVRNDSGNFKCSYFGTGGLQEPVVGSTQPLNGWTVSACKRSGNNHYARVNGTTGSVASGATIASNFTASTSYYFGDRWPGSGLPLRGALAWVAFYSSALSDANLKTIEDAYWGVPTGVSGSLAGKTYCSDYDGGAVDCFWSGASIVTANGLRTLRGNVADNKFDTDNLAATAGTDVGTPTIVSAAAPGPFYNLRRANECARVLDDDAAAFEGKQGADGYVSNGFYTASFYLQAGDAGTTVSKARIKVDVTGGGWIDAGTSQICDVTGLTYASTRATCTTPKFYADAGSPTVKASILVGNAASDTGSIMVCERQLNATSFATVPVIDNSARGNTNYSIDPSAWPDVTQGGKYEVVFVPNTNTNTDWANGGQTDTIYLFDAHDSTPNHSVVLAFGYNTAGRALARTQNGADYTEFLNDGVTLVPGSPYAVSVEWRPAGSGCNVKYRFNSCSSLSTCAATTLVSSQSGGFCPSQPTSVKLGNRYDASVPTDVNIYSVKVYTL